MSVTVVVGGQFGSEGKGKVAHHLAQEKAAAAVVRVGGSNSGHTAVDATGARVVLRQLPVGALSPDVLCVIGPGSYIDLDVLRQEIESTGLAADRLVIDPNAMMITEADRQVEASGLLQQSIGSTCSGTGASVRRRIERASSDSLACSQPALAEYVRPTTPILRGMVSAGEQVIVEGTQGFGLSLLHGPHFPHATSRDTSAAAAVAEAGLSPLDVESVVLVIRAHPIRVAGNSGPFGGEELSWTEVASEGGHSGDLAEFTSVTGRVRRVSRFDPGLVRQAIALNRPSQIVLNHVDYIDADCRDRDLTVRAREFVGWVSTAIGQDVTYAGVGPSTLVRSRGVSLVA